MPWAGKRPPVVCPPPQNNVPSNDRVSSGGTIDLERNSADAIAPAMTSSVLLPHHKAVGAECETSSQPCGEELRCVRSRISQPELTNPKENPRPTLPNYQPRRSPLPLRFSGEGPSLNRIRKTQKTTTWKRRVLPTSCGCQERNAICCILLRFRPNQKSKPGRFACSPDCNPAAPGVQCLFSVQRSEWL